MRCFCLALATAFTIAASASAEPPTDAGNPPESEGAPDLPPPAVPPPPVGEQPAQPSEAPPPTAEAPLPAAPAQPAATPPPIPQPMALLPVAINSEQPQARFSFYLQGQGPSHTPASACEGPCRLQLRPGGYSLKVEGPGLVTGTERIYIAGPTQLNVEGRTTSERSTGLTLGIVGLGLLATGFTFAVAAQSEDETKSGLLFLGIGGMIAGAVLTPIGWIKYGRSSPTVTASSL